MLDFQFSKFQIFNGRKGQEGQHASRCQISWRSVKPLLRCGDFSIFQDVGRHHLGISKFGFLTVRRVKRSNVHRSAKLRDERPNHCLDMAIFRFFKMATAAILDF